MNLFLSCCEKDSYVLLMCFCVKLNSGFRLLLILYYFIGIDYGYWNLLEWGFKWEVEYFSVVVFIFGEWEFKVEDYWNWVEKVYVNL